MNGETYFHQQTKLRIGGEENRKVMLGKPLHPQRITV